MTVATQYVSWLSAAAAQAEAASTQASAIAAAFETALEGTVQPAVVAANRNLVQALASQNHLGQNAPAIADIEAAYEQMWASDVVAMSGYHADASAAVANLKPWQQVLPKLDLGSSTGRPAFDSDLGFANNVGQSVNPGNPDTGDLGFLNSSRYVTGGVNPNLSPGMLNSATASTGFNSGVTTPGLLNQP